MHVLLNPVNLIYQKVLELFHKSQKVLHHHLSQVEKYHSVHLVRKRDTIDLVVQQCHQLTSDVHEHELLHEQLLVRTIVIQVVKEILI